MIEITDKSKCSGCYSCVNACPKKCITMISDQEGFWYPNIDKEKCIDCGLCEKRCPILNDMKVNNNPKAYACYNLNEEIRKESSSGGIFTLLASNIIDRGGIIYGAAFNHNYEVEHIKITTKKELNKLRGSKYVQSKIGEVYAEIKELLNQEKIVYFSGTPCQIDGLLCFLDKKYDNLICQDIICHGVPSPMVWKDYVESKNEEYGSKPVRINFRQKNSGWNLYELSLQYKDSSYNYCHKDDLFMRAFLSNLILRPSCYNCSSKSLHRNSDITLADFWGIDNIDKCMNDDKGISLIFINSNKGKNLFKEILDDIRYKEVDINDAVKYNCSAYLSVKEPKKRKAFFRNYGKINFEKNVNSCTKVMVHIKIKNKLKSIVHKIIKE